MSEDQRPTEDQDSTELPPTETAPPVSETGQRIGPYRLLQKLGEGGMGEVWEAEQTEPVKRRVALKLIKLGMDSKQVVARFEAERQALAMMNHPNIARVFDAGATPQGRPYFVMEHVKGVPITEHCDRQRLTTQERLGLFTEVCAGVQHAHQKAIIHRDLKPSNVLVTIQDGKAVPKIIDFGVAKAIEHRLTEQTLFTELGQIVGTPEYMSPEQAEMTQQDIDTRTDVYSLGVMLYELLVGALPFDPRELRQAGFDEIRRKIREDEPSKPSTKISTLGEASTEVAKSRRTDLSSLRKLLHGDLDWITMKALEKDRARRYGTPNELARDLEHHLANEPILAGPPRVGYKLRKFVKRNRVAVTAGALVVAALVLGVISTTIGFVQARRERDRAVDAEQQIRRQAYVANIVAAESSLKAGEIAIANRRLSLCPEKLRGWEWFYLQRMADRSQATLVGHGYDVQSVAFSPDGTRIASGSLDLTVRLWDATSGDQLATLEGHEDDVWSVAFSPDGTRIASGSWDRTVRLWDAASGALLNTLVGHESFVFSVDFSPDGTRVASASDDRTLRLWDTESGEMLATLAGHEGGVISVAFSPDGMRLASGSNDKTVRLWDAASGELLATLPGHEGGVNSVVFSPDGTRIASGSDDKTVRLWDAASGDMLATLVGHDYSVWSVAFSPDGMRLASGSNDRTVRLWDTASGEMLATLVGHEHDVWSVAFSPDGTRIASGSRDKTVRLWDAASGEPPGVLVGHEEDVRSVVFSTDGTRIASGSRDETVRLWDSATGELLATLVGHERDVLSVAFSPDGMRLASASQDKTIRVWDVETGELLDTLVGHEGTVYCVAFSPDGTRIASSSADTTVRVWDAVSGDPLATFAAHEDGVLSTTFSPDGTQIASGSRTVRLWDAASGRLLATLPGHQAWVLSIAFNADGKRIASGTWDKNARLWDATSGELLATLAESEGRVWSVVFSPDDTRIASGSRDKTVRLWDAASDELLATLAGHEGEVISVAFSPDGTRIASGSEDNTIRLWDSVPLRVRLPERQAILAARPQAARAVDELWLKGIEPKTIAARLSDNRSLSEPQRRAALNLLLERSAQLQEHIHVLYTRLVFADDVARAVEADDSLTEGVRRRAVAIVRARGDRPLRLNSDSWSLVRSPGGDQEAYELGLRGTEMAVAAEPENVAFLSTLYIAQYRNRLFDDAEKTIIRCDQLRRQQGRKSDPRDLTFLAMVLSKQGRTIDAQTTYERLEHILSEPGRDFRYDEVESPLFEECRALFGGSPTLTETLKNAEP